MTVVVYAHDAESVYDTFFLNHLLKKNHVYLLTFNRKPRFVPQGVCVAVIPEPFHPTTSPMAGLHVFLGSFLRSFLLKQRLREINHDVLISCGGLLYGFYSALSSTLPFILLIWGSDVLVAPRRLPFRFIATYSLKRASSVVVDSDVQKEACITLGCDPKKIIKFPWVDLRPIMDRGNDEDCRRNAGELKEKLGWKKHDPVVISTRHHKPVYNLECLVKAIPSVVEEVPNARFLILGKGDLTDKLQKSVVAAGAGANVRFLGEVPFHDIPKCLCMADVYVSTSLSDGTSASLIEAMASELPVVVTDIAGNREWVVDGNNGLLFPPRDSKVLAERIIRLLEDAKLRKTLSKMAFKTVTEKADWKKNSELLDKAVSSMVTLK